MSNQLINTEAGKRQLIREAVTLESCNGDSNEQRLKSIVNDLVLDYILNAYAKPYRDWKENRKIIDRDTILNSNEFLKIIGFHSDFLYFCMYCFRIPLEGEDLIMLESTKQKSLINGHTDKEEEFNKN